MTLFKTDWEVGDDQHVAAHNAIGVALNDANLRLFDPQPNVNTESARDANNAAFAAAILAAQRDTTYNESGGVYVPPGDYYIDETIAIEGHWGLKLYSHGRGARIMWRGGAGVAIAIENSRECTLSNLVISGENEGVGVKLFRSAGATVVAHHNTLEQVEIEDFADCVVIGGADTVDANNDFHEFNHCWFRNYQQYAINLQVATQSYCNRFYNCMASAAPGVGVATVITGAAGGNFSWHGGCVSGNMDADFIIGRHYQPNVISGMVSEGSKRFVRSATDNYFDVSIDACRWAGNLIHADLTAIKIDSVGVARLSIRNSLIGDGNAPTVGTLIKFAPTNADETLSGFEFVNNSVVSSALDVFSGRDPTSKNGNIQVTNETEFTVRAL